MKTEPDPTAEGLGSLLSHCTPLFSVAEPPAFCETRQMLCAPSLLPWHMLFPPATSESLSQALGRPLTQPTQGAHSEGSLCPLTL